MISVIVPVYNVASYLEKCVMSILTQSISDLQIILVDDGSTDSSLELCRKFHQMDHRVVVLHQENLGVSAARNRGLETANGDYILFADSDDWMEPDWCRMMLERMELENADLAVCGIWTGKKEKRPVIQKKELSAEEQFAALQEQGLLSPVFNKLYRCEFIREKFELGRKFGEDLLFNFSYFQQVSRIAIVPQLLYHYRKDNPLAATAIFREDKFDDILFLYQKSCDFCAEFVNFKAGKKLLKQLTAVLAGDFLGNFQRLAGRDALSPKDRRWRFRLELRRIQNNTFFAAGRHALWRQDKKWAVFLVEHQASEALYLFFRVKLWILRCRNYWKNKKLTK